MYSITHFLLWFTIGHKLYKMMAHRPLIIPLIIILRDHHQLLVLGGGQVVPRERRIGEELVAILLAELAVTPASG